MRIRLIAYWREWWKLWSLRLGALGTAVSGILIASPDAALYVWNLMPSDLKATIPPDYTPFIGVFIFVMSMFARLVKQEKLNKHGTTEDDKQ